MLHIAQNISPVLLVVLLLLLLLVLNPCLFV